MMGKSRCVVRWSREAKKIRNLIMRDHGYLVSKGEGGLLSDYHCHAAVVALQNTTYTHTDVLKKKRQKNRTISQFETDILIGGLNLFQWGKCVWLGIFYWDESTTWIGAWTHILGCCWLPNDHCCHLTVACYYTTMNGTGDWLSLLKKGTMCEKHLWWYYYAHSVWKLLKKSPFLLSSWRAIYKGIRIYSPLDLPKFTYPTADFYQNLP